jgi:hypothetical protein
MTDFVAQTPPGVNGSVYIKSSDQTDSGVSVGDGCVSNGARVVCSYRQSWNALVVYDGNGNTLWGSGALLDNHTYSGLPIIGADGSMLAADDQHIYAFNPDGSVAWVTVNPGGTPVSLVPTPNGALAAATDPQPLTQCWQGNCTLAFTVGNGGAGYTAASVILAGGYCPGASATATISGGAVTAVTAISQGLDCDVAPDVIVLGDGTGASASAVLTAAAPVTVFNGTTGAVVGSTYLYQTGNSGPYYATINTPCVNNGSYPNRLYVITALANDQTQGALWALDIDPTNLSSPITPAWSLVMHGPSGASPLCVGNNVYFDGAGILPGDNVGTTIFGVQDNGTSGAFLFQQALGAGTQKVTCNFALDPRSVGGFWHQIQYDPKIYHRDYNTGNLIESINVGTLLTAFGAPPSTYWQAGIFTTYGTVTQPFLMLPEAAYPAKTGGPGYLAMLDIAAQHLVWAVPLAGTDTAAFDSPGGDAALVLDSNQNPVIVMSGKQSAAYFITNGGPDSSVFPGQLSFGQQTTGASSGPQTVTLFNSASTVLKIGSIAATGPFSAVSACGATLAPGTSCTIAVTFSPTATGPQSGAVAIASNSQGSPQTVPLDGIGMAAAPVALLSASQLTFPPQAAGTVSPPQTVTLQNTGTMGLAIASIAAGGAAAQTNNCPTDLARGASCTINVMLAAPLSGTCSGTVSVATNAPGGPQDISVSGACLPLPGIESALSTSSLVFVPQTAGAVSPAQTVTLSNIGALSLTVAAIVATGDATQTNTCGAALAVGANCVITIAFAPAATGPRSGTVIVTDAAPDSPHAIAVSGVGLPNPVPIVYQPLIPTAVQPGAPGLTLTVNGTGFLPASVVYWNGTPRITQLTGNSQLSASLTAADLAAPGTGSVSVVNPSPGGGQSNVVWLPVGYPSPAPVPAVTTIPASSGPSSVAAADFNNDGKLDLAVSNSGANTVSILLGNGDGTFAPKVDYPTGNAPIGAAVGDFNHDGIPDLAVLNQVDNTVSILLGAGGGLFASQTAYATGIAPSAVVVADLNGDGNLDLAVANQSGNGVSILFGNGDGTFAPQLAYAAGENPAALIAADFNGDGKLDLAVGNDVTPGGTVTILLNHGDGSFLPGVAYATGDSLSLVAADFNGDGILDFAAANYLAQSLSVYLGNGNGTFKVGPSQTTRLSPNLIGLAAADVNADGTLELLMGGNSDIGFTVVENNDAGIFSSILQSGVVAGVTALAVGDFNNDGSIDMAVVSSGSNRISVLLQSPAVTLSSASVGFGNVAVGGSGAQSLTLANSGSAVLLVGSVSASGNFSQTNNCASAIAPGNACTVTVAFSPAALGSQSGVLTIADNVPGGPQTVNLSGVGATFAVSIALAVNTVVGGNPLPSNTVTLSSPAPAGGWTVNLSSSNPAIASVPVSVAVAAGATVSSAFTVSTSAVSSNTPVTIAASVNGSAANAILTVNPIAVAFSLAASSVYGGNPLLPNTLTLSSPAPAGGLVFNLSSSNAALASVPASVIVAAGATVSQSFSINTAAVASETTVAIFATLSGVSGAIANATLTLDAPQIGSLALSPAAVTSGASTTANLVNLAGPAPPGGATISLSSSKPSVAAVPSTVTVPGNASASAPFTIATGYVMASTPVTITAKFSGASATATLTVNPDGVASLNLSSTSVVGGAAAAAANTVTLLTPAPSAGATVKLSSGNPAVASVPGSVKVVAGATTSPVFKITTTAVSVSTPVSITAAYNGLAVPVTLTVNPLAPTSVTLGQTGVAGGKTVSASVALNAAAPSGGITVSLSSSNPAVAGVPATVTVAAGAHTAKFSVSTSAVAKQTTVTITASYQGNSAAATLTVKP